MNKTLLLGGTIVRENAMQKADVLIDITGHIEFIGNVQDHKNCDIVDCSDKLLFPLLIDCHVHFREPGLEHKATMHTESAAALAGGVGCVCEMPNTIPPTVTIASLADKVKRATLIDQCVLKFFFGVTEATHLQTLRDIWTGTSMELKKLKHHCSGLKLYLDHSTGDQKVDGGIVDDIFKTCAELKIPLVAHCEDADMNDTARKNVETYTSLPISLHSDMRPPESEAKAITEAIALTKKHGTAFHIAHLSTALGIDLVRKAKKDGVSVTCEVAPHHLFLTTDDYEKLGALGKMNPPLRSKADQDALWQGIMDGTVDCISTDHAPHTLEEKLHQGTSLLSDVPSGVPGVETMLPLLLTIAAKASPHSQFSILNSQLSYSDILRLCFTNPNRIFSLGQPDIKQGSKARIAIIDPAKQWQLHGKDMQTKCKWTPYEGWTMTGSIEQVIVH